MLLELKVFYDPVESDITCLLHLNSRPTVVSWIIFGLPLDEGSLQNLQCGQLIGYHVTYFSFHYIASFFCIVSLAVTLRQPTSTIMCSVEYFWRPVSLLHQDYPVSTLHPCIYIVVRAASFSLVLLTRGYCLCLSLLNFVSNDLYFLSITCFTSSHRSIGAIFAARRPVSHSSTRTSGEFQSNTAEWR